MKEYGDGAVVNGYCDIARQNFRKKSRTYRLASHSCLARNNVFLISEFCCYCRQLFQLFLYSTIQLASMISSSDSCAVLVEITEKSKIVCVRRRFKTYKKTVQTSMIKAIPVNLSQCVVKNIDWLSTADHMTRSIGPSERKKYRLLMAHG
jgi:hypothetical protein